MEERAWVQRPERQMRFHVRRSSRDRSWRGFEVTLYDATDGYSDILFTQHSVSMHVGRPTLVTSGCDGEVVHRLQVPGDLKVIPAGYSRIWEIAEPTRKLVIDLRPWFVREVAQEMGLNPDSVAIAPQLHLTDPRIEHIGWALLGELEASDPSPRLYAESLAYALTSHLLQRYAPKIAARPTGLPKRRLREVLEYIREHMARELSLNELAAVAGMSPSHFKTCFKESIGMPVHQYVIAARVEYALQLLTHTSLPLCEVALCAGFANQSHLSRHMRRFHNITPAALRKLSK
jgi:AraC family transcriptional regulator